MSQYEKEKVEIDLKKFANANFVSPSNCRNIDQIRFYVRELCIKIDEYERRFDFVPGWAYSLLAQYNIAQNRMIQVEFRKAYL